MRTFSQEHFVGTDLGPCPPGPRVKVSYLGLFTIPTFIAGLQVLQVASNGKTGNQYPQYLEMGGGTLVTCIYITDHM